MAPPLDPLGQGSGEDRAARDRRPAPPLPAHQPVPDVEASSTARRSPSLPPGNNGSAWAACGVVMGLSPNLRPVRSVKAAGHPLIGALASGVRVDQTIRLRPSNGSSFSQVGASGKDGAVQPTAFPRTERRRGTLNEQAQELASPTELPPVSRTPNLGVKIEPEVDHGTETIQPRIQARGSDAGAQARRDSSPGGPAISMCTRTC